MSVRLWKDVLHPGRQRDRFGHWFTITPRQTAEALANVRKMIARGLRIPAVWEHQSTAEPVELSRDDRIARYARNTFGSVVDARRDGRGVLWLRHAVDDPADVAQLRKTKFVSPKLYPGYSDSRGGEYRGTTIAHVAATPTPVQFWQGGDWVRELSTGSLYLSYTPEGEAVADDADKTKTGDDADGAKRLDADLAALIDALRGAGLTIPDEVKDVPGLIIAVKASGTKPGDDDLDLEGEGDPDPEPGPTDTTPGGGAPMLMSDDRAEPLRKRDRAGLKHRIEALFRTGRVDKPTAVKLGRELQAVSLSYTADGELFNCPLDAKVAAYEELPKGRAWAPTGSPRKGAEPSATPEDAPGVLTGDATAEENEVVKKQEEYAQRYSVKPRA